METNYLKKELYELIKSDERIFDFIQESCLDGMWYWDLENPEEEWMNPKFWEVLGYNPSEMPHKTSAWKDIIHPDDLKIATEKITQHLENPNYPYDQTVRYTHQNGSTVWIRCRGLAIRDKHGKPLRMLGAHQNITAFRNSESQFQKSADLLRNAQQVSKLGSWELDLKTNEVVWTEELYNMYGFDPTKPPPPYTEHMKLFTPESWEQLTSSLALTREQGIPYELELRTIQKDGSRGWMWVRGEAIYSESKEIIGLRGVAQDITERKNIELEKEALTKRLNYAMDASGDGIWDWTPKNGVTVYSKAWVEMLGYKVGELASLASEWSDRLHPDDIEWVFAAINKVTQTPENGDAFSHEYRFRNKEGEYLWILNTAKVVERNEDGEATRVVGTHKNITGRKKVDEEKKESELRFAVAIEGTEAGVWDWDMINNKVVFSKQWKTMLGYEDSEIENSFEGWKNLWHPDDADSINKAVADHLNGITKKYEIVHRCLHKDGSWRWIMTRGKLLRDEEGKPYRWIGTNVDITAQKNAEEEEKKAKEQAETASKAKSEFLANMSHEIRTPLNGVIGFTELLTKTPLSPVQQQYVNSANVSGHTLLGIINDILDFSKIEAGMLELEEIRTDMIALFENCIDIVKFSAAEKGLELLMDIDPGMPRFAHIDPIRTQQILANLLGNAVKFTQKGEVTVKVEFLPLGQDQGTLKIAVRDTGIGINEEQKAKLFKSFSQADSSTTRKFGGTGLGLVISQMIAEKMGSKIQIDSKPNVGTTFFFEIITHFEEGEKPDPTKITGVKRCLIIDDNAYNRVILQQMLDQWQIDSDTCENGFQALQVMEKALPYDVIICDYHMPYINGLETIRLMKEKLNLNLETHPVILLYSSAQDEIIHQKSMEIGVRFRLTKPVKSQDLFTFLSNLNQDLKAGPRQETEAKKPAFDSKEKIKILIAEDNALNMVLSKTLLLQLMPNSEICEAADGLVAVAQYKKLNPDIVFMDIQMPELDGIGATKQIRIIEKGTGRHIPIIALTAGALKEEKEKCLAAGMDEFLTKPLEVQKIESVLKKFFRQDKEADADKNEAIATNEVHFGYSELLNSLGGDIKSAQHLISMLLADMPDKINQLNLAYEEKDSKTIRQIAHSIKGSMLAIRCNILADIATKIENDTEENSLEMLEKRLTALKKEWGFVKKLLLEKIDE
ncbi:PAS domain-containing protein [Cyclobacterium marinum]|uniref:histidine kinase n=1 Tax=Cyclobacterium marinum (strain ATCC 25205 / DSM 745 / LMG 13164 / NCIMB 1802) TaxID=880070 RepID=G0J4I6_CYCMS|nr:PAS domain-containing protein [Cyclobacterium marinum]AEL24651.1 multi-sensor hybrid histidine kinase [Cyclobacterium marinum DSM 745]